MAPWGEPLIPVEKLREDQVDPGIWTIVERINRSGWVTTTESCEGHATRPALLGLATDDLDRLLGLLGRAVIEGATAPRDTRFDPNTLTLELRFHAPARVGKYTVRARVVGPLPEARAILRAFAEAT